MSEIGGERCESARPIGWLGRPRIRLLNADIDNLTMDELVDRFKEGMLLTLHVDMLAKLQKDREFYEILPEFEVVTCDSQILALASKFLGTPVLERVSGSDFFPLWYMRHKDDPEVTVFICGGSPGIAEVARDKINERVGRRMVIGTDAPPLDFETKPGEIDRMIDKINESGASTLAIGLGGGRQEKFIVKYRSRFESIRTYLPIGGTIDYEAATLKRPAPWITDSGFEWLYRVMREPRQRWRRYFIHQPPVLYYLIRQKLGIYRNPFE
jgi:N-acetylglucosaminyldiphosphoundecaprenol N-acetyl-beta-D-mannosaminyltransferase